jgi:hypothetical protein
LIAAVGIGAVVFGAVLAGIFLDPMGGYQPWDQVTFHYYASWWLQWYIRSTP